MHGRMRGLRLALPEGELTLVEDDVPQREHAPCGEVEASVAAVIGRVADEDAQRGSGLELMGRRRGSVGEAQRAEHPKLVVAGRNAEEELEGRGGAGGTARPAVDEVRGRGERLGPERVLRAAVNEESPDAVVQRAKDALGLPVLLRCVQAGEPELGAMAGKESSQRAGVELPSVVCLQSKHTQTKLGTHVSMEVAQDRQCF